MVFLANGTDFTYVERLYGSPTYLDPFRDPETFEILDLSGESYLVVRAAERDAELRLAVHDDGQRLAWRLA